MILVTGAFGFVGSALCPRLKQNFPLRISARRKSKTAVYSNLEFFQASLTPDQDWSLGLIDVSIIVHCAARVHVMNDKANDPLLEFRAVNVDGLLNLARQAAKAGVRRFIFLSSIKVNGESTVLGHPFTADQVPAPIDDYGVSKYEAEIGLRKLSLETEMEIVIIRSPLVYGPGVKANFLSMINWMQRGVPLPLGGIKKNRRSFVFPNNLIDLIVICLHHPAAANQTLLVSDDEDLSTVLLLQRMALALKTSSKLVPVPIALIILGAKLFGRPDISSRLCDSLQVDISKTKELLGWSPPVSVEEGLRRTADHFLMMKS
jgi:nucleoside-diphosphate-sugar epimerase